MRKHIFYLTILILFLGAPSFADRTIAVLPFEDHSGFDGRWDIGAGLSRLLSERLGAVPGYWAVEPDSAMPAETARLDTAADSVCSQEALLDSMKAGYFIAGTIGEFGISRFGIATPTLGGYQSYRAGVMASFSVRERGAGAALLTDRSEGEVKQGGLGLTLFGKPTDEMQQWEMLDGLEFGSQAFMATIIGGAVDTLLNDMVQKIRTALPPQRELSSAIGPAVIISVEGEQAYINRGYEDGLRVGDRFEIYRKGEELRDPQTSELLGYSDQKVGAIRVTFVKSGHLSVAEAVEGVGEIKAGDEVR